MERNADGRIRTTEWEDIQYKHGNKVGKYTTHEGELLAQRVKDANPNILLKVYDANEEKVRDKLARGGYDVDPAVTVDPDDIDDSDDDDALAAFRNKRMAELQRVAQTNVFGVVRNISGAEYVQEITDSSQQCWVVGIMIAQGHEGCDALLKVLQLVAMKHRDVKFVSLLAKEAVAKMPDRLLPCVVFYHKGSLVNQLTEITVWEDSKRCVSVEAAERVLSRVGVIKSEEDDDEDEDDFQKQFALRSGDAIRRK
ncbi:phosducin-like protein, putative [Bodo saltans]|uniref:Phosducin-like protein, putative n=1 Tax=Bodo saltans TaxID=75058 RepID=A0A0S4J2X1_BODSA|nr:phosducin-like protein, putative [Bodo saltans]|eukprot:CUG69172.1 phosducin-like protein, putative [Bodo saltans]